MTPDQMAELAARLHVAADSQREYSQSVESLDWAADLDRAADLIAGTAQRVPLSDDPPPEFVAWVRHNIPAGTVISDPGWWIPRLWRAVRNSTTDRQEDAA